MTTPTPNVPLLDTPTLAAELARTRQALLATPESRARFEAYLAGLVADGYACCKQMARYIAKSAAAIAAAETADRENDPSSPPSFPTVGEPTPGGAADG